jgi:hypothetical protein
MRSVIDEPVATAARTAELSPCNTPGSYTVVERHSDRHAGVSDCRSGTDVYEVSDPTNGDYFSICMTKN